MCVRACVWCACVCVRVCACKDTVINNNVEIIIVAITISRNDDNHKGDEFYLQATKSPLVKHAVVCNFEVNLFKSLARNQRAYMKCNKTQ